MQRTYRIEFYNEEELNLIDLILRRRQEEIMNDNDKTQQWVQLNSICNRIEHRLEIINKEKNRWKKSKLKEGK